MTTMRMMKTYMTAARFAVLTIPKRRIRNIDPSS
jgi:hypothetical protein